MDALMFLRRDHESVLGMFESLSAAPPGGEAELANRNDMVTSLVIAESQHEAVEEQLFWPTVRESVPDGDSLADQAIEQEDEGKQLLQQLEKGKAGERDFEHALGEFIAAAREHIAFEQNQVWPRFSESVTSKDSDELGEKMAKAKETAPTRPHPHTPSSSGVQKTMGTAAAATDRMRDAMTGREEKNPPDIPPS